MASGLRSLRAVTAVLYARAMRRTAKMMSLLGFVVMAGAGPACGPPSEPAATPPPPAAVATMGKYSVALGRSVQEILTGAAPPQWLTCADPKTDIRSTQKSERDKFAILGPAPQLVMSGLKVSLSSGGKESSGAFVDGRTLTGPNEKVTWVELTGQTGSMRVPFDNRAKLADLAAPLGPDLQAFVGGLSGSCQASLLEEADLDALPYEVSKDERDAIMVGMRRVKDNLRGSCGAAAAGQGPWEVHFHHADLVFRGAGHMARVRTRLHIEGTSVCAGPIEIEQLIAG